MKTTNKTHIKVGDLVKVITGSYKNKLGRVVGIDRVKLLAVLDSIVPNIKRIKATNKGDATTKRLPVMIAVSNLMFWDEAVGVASRVGSRINETTSKKEKFFKRTGNTVT